MCSLVNIPLEIFYILFLIFIHVYYPLVIEIYNNTYNKCFRLDYKQNIIIGFNDNLKKPNYNPEITR